MRFVPGLGQLAVLVAASSCVLTLISGCGGPDPLPPEVPGRPAIALHCAAFDMDGAIPKMFTCDGEDRSPPLGWSGVPESARTLALICDDPDAPAGTFSHWVVFNLSPQVKGLKEAVPAQDTIPTEKTVVAESAAKDVAPPRQGKNDFGKTGYGGPCPPSGTHHYVFRLYALDTSLDLKATASRADVLKALQNHILAEGRLTGQYARSSRK
jgi:Raf kinase inhibitor-like YbhB/YbcL family protein